MNIIRYRSAFVVVVLLLLFLSLSRSPVYAINELVLTDKSDEYDLAPYVEVLKDAGGRLTVSDVLKPDAAGRFVSHAWSTDPSEGYAQPAHWVRIPLRNGSNQPAWLVTIDYPAMDRIDYYVVADGIPIVHREGGDLIPFGQKQILDRTHTFPLKLEKEQDIVLLLRFETEGAMSYPIKLADPIHYAKREQTAGLLIGSFYGVMLAMTMYNCILAFTLRSRTNWYYVLTNASVIALFSTFNGISFEYIWPNAVWWNNRAIVFFMCVAHIAALLFARTFLDLKRSERKLYTTFSFLIGIGVLNLIVLAVSYPIGLQMSIYSSGLIDAVIVAAGVVSMRRGYQSAGFFVLGWSVFVLGEVITTMTDAGHIPRTAATAYASQIGSVLEAVVLSLALTGQFSKMKREKELVLEQMKETSRLADCDDLTGLYNRRYLLRTFQNIVYHTDVQTVSVLLLDVDHFKQVNDSYGHDVGDSVLKQMAHMMQDCFRPTDIVGRFGGEEFMVLLPNTNVDQAGRAAEYLLQMLRTQPFETGEHTLSCTVSVGIAEWNGVFEDDFERMLRRADEALYEAKRSGRNQICTNVIRRSRLQEEA